MCSHHSQLYMLSCQNQKCSVVSCYASVKGARKAKPTDSAHLGPEDPTTAKLFWGGRSRGPCPVKARSISGPGTKFLSRCTVCQSSTLPEGVVEHHPHAPLALNLTSLEKEKALPWPRSRGSTRQPCFSALGLRGAHVAQYLYTNPQDLEERGVSMEPARTSTTSEGKISIVSSHVLP